MIYVEITEDSFIDAMNLAHTSKGHGFSDDGLLPRLTPKNPK
jgi:hypothetical protein